MAPGKVVEDAPRTNGPLTSSTGLMTPNASTAAPKWTPQTVLSTLPELFPPHTTTPIPFFHLLSRLKTTKREGWRRFSINHGESIADHMYRMSIITMLAPRSLTDKLDTQRCTRMALVHDMAEALVGDITPVDGVSKEEKRRREAETMEYICSDLLGKVDGGLGGEEVRRLWWEYENDETEEAHFVHDVDKVELLLQMVEYEKAGEGRVDLQEFTWVAGRVGLPECREWVREILREREEFWKKIGKVPEGRKEIPEDIEKEKREYEKYYGKEENREEKREGKA